MLIFMGILTEIIGLERLIQRVFISGNKKNLHYKLYDAKFF